MDDPASLPPAPASAARGGRRRRWTRWLLICALLLIALGSASAWLLLSTSGLHWLAERLAAASDGRVAIESASGRLVGPLAIRRLDLKLGSTRLGLHEVSLDWHPGALLRGVVDLSYLRLGRLDILRGASRDPPSGMPNDLRSPLAWQVGHLTVGEVWLGEDVGEDAVESAGEDASKDANKGAGAATSPLLSALDAQIAGDSRGYRLPRLRTRLGAGTLEASGQLDGVAPFALTLQADYAGQVAALADRALDMHLAAEGSLLDLRVTVASTGAGARLDGLARLRPFDAHPVAALKLNAKELDPRVFAAQAPGARLHVEADLADDGSGALVGPWRIANAEAGPLDRQRLPVVSLAARTRISWQAGQVGPHGAGAQTMRSLQLSDLQLGLHGGGRLSGAVELAWPTGTAWPHGLAELRLTDIDPARLHGALQAARLSGRITLAGDPDAQHLKAELADGPLRLDAQLDHGDETLTLSRLSLRRGRAELSGDGFVHFSGPRAWQFNAALSQFDPAVLMNLADQPISERTTRINAQASGAGRLKPHPSGSVHLEIADSQLAGQNLQGAAELGFVDIESLPALLAGKGGASVSGRANLALASSRLAVAGYWGNGASAAAATDGGETLTLHLTAPDLARHATLASALAPALAGLAGALDIDLRYGAGTLALKADARHLAVDRRRLDAAHLSIDGTREAHRLRAVVALPAERELQLALAGRLDAVDGQWRDWRHWTWQGLLETLNLTGDWPVALVQPAELTIDATKLSLGDTGLRAGGGRIELAETVWTPDGWTTRGSVSNIAFAPGDAGRANGQWAVSADGESLTGSVEASIPDLRGLGPLLGDKYTTAGALTLNATLAGSPAAPGLQGELRGSDLAFGLTEQNIAFTQGALAIRFDDSQALIEQCEFSAPHDIPPRIAAIAEIEPAHEPGKLAITGAIDFKRVQTRLEAKLSAVPLSQRQDRWLVGSGTAHLEHAEGHLRLGADLTADGGYIGGLISGQPTLADDIVVLGREPASRSPLRVATDLTLDLGKHFHLRTAGLSARLSGQLRVRGNGETPLAATGSIKARDGLYEAYGQRLTLDRGIVNFQGRLDDPGLNVVALRKGLAVEAGVEVTGTAQRPRVRLVSTPTVPDAEKLSWIVLGRAPDASGTDTALLVAAASSILGGDGESLTSRISRVVGLDEISLRQETGADSVTTQIVSVGKRLSARAFLSYEQGLTAAAGTLKLTYTLSRRLSLVTRTGGDNALDIFYNFFFD